MRNRLRRAAVLVAVAAVFAAMVPSAPAAATVPCRTIVGPVMYGLGAGPEYGVCLNVIVGNQLGNSFTVMAGATPTGAGQPAYIWVSDSVCSSPAFCVFAGAGVTKSGTISAAPFAYVCYIDQLGSGFCVPDLDPAAFAAALNSLDLDARTAAKVTDALAQLQVRAVPTM